MLGLLACIATTLPAMAGPTQPDFRASEGRWLLGGEPFVGTTAHAAFHTFKRDREAGLRDLEGMVEAGFTTAEVYWIWARDLSEDGGFDFGAFDEFVLACKSLGLLNFCAIIHPAPEWMNLRYGWHHLDEDGEGRTADGFYVCDPDYVAESDRFIQALVDHLGERPEISANILHFALGGEYFPFQPDRDFDTGYEEATVSAFRADLKARTTLAELGLRWNDDEETFADWSGVWPSVAQAEQDFTGRALAGWEAARWDWYEFRAEQVTAFFRHTVEVMRSSGDTRPITHEYNVRAPGQRRHMRWETLADDETDLRLAVMDFTRGYDYADMAWWCALARGGSHPPQQVNEFTGYADWHWLTRHAWALQAMGATGLNVWDWRSADWGLHLPDGTPRHGRGAVERFNAQVGALGELLAGSRPMAEEIAILMLDEEDFRRPHAHQTEIKQLLAGLMAVGAVGQTSIVTNAALLDSRIADARLIIVPHLRHVRASVAERLARFVREGGTLWLMPGSFTHDELGEEYATRPCGPLAEAAGVESRPLRDPVLGQVVAEARVGRMRAGTTATGALVERLRVIDATVIASLGGRPALTMGRSGKGQCIYQAAEFADLSRVADGWDGQTPAVTRQLASQFQRVPDAVLRALLAAARIDPPATLTTDDASPTGVFLGARELERGRLIFLIDLYNEGHALRVEVSDPPRGGRAMRVLPEMSSPARLRAGAVETTLDPAGVEAWLVAPEAEVIEWRERLLPGMEAVADLPAPPPADAPHAAGGEVVSARSGPPRDLGGGYLALDLSAHANRSLVEDPKPGELAQFVTRRLDADVAGGRLDLTFEADGNAPTGAFWVVNAVDVEPKGEGEALRLDFGSGPAFEGYQPVTEADAYSSEQGFGWLDVAGLSSRDRHSSAADTLRRDFVLDRADNAPHTFRIDLADGPYSVSVTMGDAHFQWGPMSVLADSVAKLTGIETGSRSDVKLDLNAPRRRFFGSPGNDLQELPVGDIELNGVPYHVIDPGSRDTSCLVFRSRTRDISNLVGAEGISVGRAGIAALHFVHTAGWSAPRGMPIGRYIARYADGTEAVRQIVFGQNVGSWWGDGREHGAGCEPAWIGSNPGTRRWDTNCVLWHHRWENPHPRKQLETLSIEGYGLASNVCVIAVTAETE